MKVIAFFFLVKSFILVLIFMNSSVVCRINRLNFVLICGICALQLPSEMRWKFFYLNVNCLLLLNLLLILLSDSLVEKKIKKNN